MCWRRPVFPEVHLLSVGETGVTDVLLAPAHPRPASIAGRGEANMARTKQTARKSTVRSVSQDGCGCAFSLATELVTTRWRPTAGKDVSARSLRPVHEEHVEDIVSRIVPYYRPFNGFTHSCAHHPQTSFPLLQGGK
jgi:hypothetical protein